MLQNRFAANIEAVRAELAPQQAAFLFKTGTGRNYPMASDASGKSLEERPSENAPAHPHTTPAPSNKTAADILAERMKNLPHGNRRTEPEPAPAAANPTAKTKHDEQSSTAETRYSQTNLSSDYTFETLVEGKGNRIAAAAAQSIAENPGQSYNPFFLYGSTGLGKTHLVQAIGNELLKNRPARQSALHALRRLYTQLYERRTHQQLRRVQTAIQQYDLLIIDDIQFIKGKDRTDGRIFLSVQPLP